MVDPRTINLSDPKWLPGEKPVVKNVRAAASSDNAVVTHTMLKVIRDGGNAVDAAIAGCMVQAAIEPFMTNHTGTVTFLFYHAKEDKYYQLDSTGTFPADLPPHMPVPQGMGPYAGIPPRSVIPGFMPGLKAIHERFATLEWEVLCEEAVWWAEKGHHVSHFEHEVNLFGEDFITFFPEGRAFYMPEGRFPRVGDRFGSSEMAQTMKKVAEEGPNYMITGEWADAFITKANELGWMISREHMIENPPRWMEPIRFFVGDYEIVSLAPPQQQGVFIALVLGILDKVGIREVKPYSAEHIFYMGHALKMAQTMCGYCHDPHILHVKESSFLDQGFHASLVSLIKGMKPQVNLTSHTAFTTGFGGSTPFIDSMTGGKIPTQRQNSHHDQPSGSCELSIVDAEGNWVQMMNTLQSGGIPGQVVKGIPMVGSHAIPNVQASSMQYYQAKGARMRSVIGNTMVLKNGKPILQLGSPGNVHVTVPQVLCNILFFGMEPYEAIRAPRMLALQDGGTIVIEDRIPEDVQHELLALGIRMKVSGIWDYHMGSFQICYRDQETDELCTIADPRRCGVADGLR
ncbi:gamma-glutamyltransferase [Brevibacillus reuszeri]|uniref:gamma-glutamyltransferase n=1 Tax=Brevibacillus reuszeri TaxID=54915 RepID=UPI0028A299DB|nr:gamma-glutamyltransferase [Brevibacillus reuszeri]